MSAALSFALSCGSCDSVCFTAGKQPALAGWQTCTDIAGIKLHALVGHCNACYCNACQIYEGSECLHEQLDVNSSSNSLPDQGRAHRGWSKLLPVGLHASLQPSALMPGQGQSQTALERAASAPARPSCVQPGLLPLLSHRSQPASVKLVTAAECHPLCAVL